MSLTKSTTPTKALYQLDETLRTHIAPVLTLLRFEDLDEAERNLFKPASDAAYHAIVTEETIFYAQGGGQPFDTGFMQVCGSKAKFNVEAVRSGAGGKILHFGAFEEDGASLAAGDMVEQHIDGKRRDENSKSHTAGHVIGLAVRRLTEKEVYVNVTELKASHYPGASFVEFTGLIDGKFKDAIQSQATEYMKQALPIKLYWFKPEELGEQGVITAEGMPIVAGPDGNVSIVDIVGAGAYPCGGTHVQDTSLVGEVTVKSIKRSKGISKVSYTIS